MMKKEMSNNEIIKALKESPIFNISLCSKELSHSNFWAWLIENDHGFVDIFLCGKCQDKEFDYVKREENHRDISIHFKTDEVFIIENKIKSVPSDDRQLKKYTEGLKQRFAGGLLTGLDEESPINLPENWYYMSYGKIAEEIKKHLDCKNRNTQNSRKASLIEKNTHIIQQYIEDINNIVRLYKNYYTENKINKFPIADDYKDLEEIRFSDVFRKKQAERIVEKLKDDIKKDYKSDASFNNDQTTITLKKIKNVNHNESIFVAGIQIQNDQYRRFYIAKKRDAEFEKAWLGSSEVFSSSKKSIKFPGDDNCRNTKMKIEICKYENCRIEENSERFTFYYKYWTMDKMTMDYDKTKEIIKKDLEYLDSLKKMQR